MATTSSKRRSAAAWTKLIAAWRRSGQTADAFAAEHGLRPATLTWWRWQLGRRNKPRRRVSPTPRLVAVEVMADAQGDVHAPAAAWELEGAGGLVLRVHKAMAAHELERILAAMTTPTRAAP